MPAIRTRFLMLLVLALLAGCRSEKVAFQFRPPQAPPARRAATRQLAGPAAAVPPPAAPATAPPVPLPHPTTPHRRAPQPKARRLAPLPLKQVKQLARAGQQLTSPLRRSEDRAQHMGPHFGFTAGFVLLGLGILLFLLVVLLAPTVATFEGILLIILGYGASIALFISGLVTLLIAALTT